VKNFCCLFHRHRVDGRKAIRMWISGLLIKSMWFYYFTFIFYRYTYYIFTRPPTTVNDQSLLNSPASLSKVLFATVFFYAYYIIHGARFVKFSCLPFVGLPATLHVRWSMRWRQMITREISCNVHNIFYYLSINKHPE
jgi:hypothetical protein